MDKLVNRTCTEISSEDKSSHPLEAYRDKAAYVLLGDPGAGKTTAFENEAEKTNGRYITARDFVTFENKINPDEPLFIDALDEMPSEGGDRRAPFDRIRSKLYKLNNVRFRLSCREADWLGASGSDALKPVSPDHSIIELRLDPLTDHDILTLLKEEHSVSDAGDFVRQAKLNELAELLRNPQTLNLLAKAIHEGKWPHSREETYELACRELAKEINPEHREANRNRPISIDSLMEAAGYLNAIQILSGASGQQNIELTTLKNPKQLPLSDVLKTKLFRNDENQGHTYVHRSVGEYLSAKYLAQLIEHNGLPSHRVLALITGEDGGVASDLRGIFAWLSVHCRSGRYALIEKDPLGIVLYGDVKNFSVSDKERVLHCLSNEAQRNPWFRSEDWTSSPFGAIATRDMESRLREILNSSSQSNSDQIFLNCVLDALRYGESMPNLNDALMNIVRDAYSHPSNRTKALAVLMGFQDAQSAILTLAQDIRNGRVEDRDDEVLGHILSGFYPNVIDSKYIFDFIHAPKYRSLIGSYFSFWADELSQKTKRENLPLLLDSLIPKKDYIEGLTNEHLFQGMMEKLMVRAVTEFGDTRDDETLYQWLGLGLGLNKYGHRKHYDDEVKAIRIWFETRVTRYKKVLECGLRFIEKQNENVNFHHYDSCKARFYGFIPPLEIREWYLEKAEIALQENQALADFFFHLTLQFMKESNQGNLTLSDLEFLSPWLNRNERFRVWIEPFISCNLSDEQQNNWQQQAAIKQKSITNERITHFRQHFSAILDGSAPHKILHELAAAQNDFLNADAELMHAAHEGFQRALFREDLPSVKEIIDLSAKDKMHHLIRLPCLTGMKDLYTKNPTEAMNLNDATLSRLVAFRLTDGMDEDPAWFKDLISKKSSLVANVYISFAAAMFKAKKEHIHDIYSIAYDDEYAPLAKLTITKLLELFPLRALEKQLSNTLVPLLKGALYYLDNDSLLDIVSNKLGMKSLHAMQRVYWLCAGLILKPTLYEEDLSQYIENSNPRKNCVSEFFYDRVKRKESSIERLPDSSISLIIELLGPIARVAYPAGGSWTTPDMHTGELVESAIQVLSMRTTESAKNALIRLVSLPSLSLWKTFLQKELHSNQLAQRAASFSHANIEAIDRTLANLEPASTADLAALTFDHLRDIAKKIRDGNTNDYRQYWNHPNDKSNCCPKYENDCRDALLSDLKERLGKHGVDAQSESNYADNKRADISVSFGGANGFKVPIEIKRESHEDLWQAIHTQLIARYTRDPCAEGYGIYLVFWFGGNEIKKPPPDGESKPRSANDLEERLRQTLSTLSPEKRHRTQICVIDCALPER